MGRRLFAKSIMPNQKGFFHLTAIIFFIILIGGLIVSVNLTQHNQDNRSRASSEQVCNGNLELITPTENSQLTKKVVVTWDLTPQIGYSNNSCNIYINYGETTPKVVSNNCQGQEILSTITGNAYGDADIYELVVSNGLGTCLNKSASTLRFSEVQNPQSAPSLPKPAPRLPPQSTQNPITQPTNPPSNPVVSPNPQPPTGGNPPTTPEPSSVSSADLEARIKNQFSVNMTGFDQVHLKWAYDEFSKNSNNKFSSLIVGANIEASTDNSLETPVICDLTIKVRQINNEKVFKYTLDHQLGHYIYECKTLTQSYRYPDFDNVFKTEGAATLHAMCPSKPLQSLPEDYADMIAYYLNPDFDQPFDAPAGCAIPGKDLKDKSNPFKNPSRFPKHLALAKRIIDRNTSLPAVATPVVPPPPGGGSGTVPSNPAPIASVTYRPKVLLLIFDPKFKSLNNQLLRTAKGWNDPDRLTRNFISDINEASAGIVNYQIVEKVVKDEIPIREDGYQYTEEAYLKCLENQTTCHKPGADYRKILDSVDACNKRNNDQIDEVWIWGEHNFGFDEWDLAGPGGITNPNHIGTNCRKLLPVFGFNYGRAETEMLEDMGHRLEATMTVVYGRWNAGYGKPRNASIENTWDQFTIVDYQKEGEGGCGNAHDAVNAQSTNSGNGTYDRENRRFVKSYCDDFINYPNLKKEQKLINCASWGCTGRGYLKWWMNHMPKRDGSTDSKLNNWWSYIIDPDKNLKK